ncbi:olfactory receptor 14J1-like [Mycteria americana]|uniref:olfactory receptor 14J1-like n=1 Tax=Mycteria americana TaxID=33587 RepID=UPI003F58BB90
MSMRHLPLQSMVIWLIQLMGKMADGYGKDYSWSPDYLSLTTEMPRISNSEEDCPAEFYLLTVMAYDRYVAICKPLHYGTLLGSRACVHMAAAAWGSGFLNSLLHTVITFSIPLCHGNALDQFFCEIPQILKLSCSEAYLSEVGLIVVSTILFLVCFVFTALSYVQIFRAVLRVPSEQGRHKAFSTCIPHLAVVSLLVSTGMVAYLKPLSISSASLNLVVAVLYAVVPPAVNPLIYSLRNQELKDALRKQIQWFHLQQQ